MSQTSKTHEAESQTFNWSIVAECLHVLAKMGLFRITGQAIVR